MQGNTICYSAELQYGEPLVVRTYSICPSGDGTGRARESFYLPQVGEILCAYQRGVRDDIFVDVLEYEDNRDDSMVLVEFILILTGTLAPESSTDFKASGYIGKLRHYGEASHLFYRIP